MVLGGPGRSRRRPGGRGGVDRWEGEASAAALERGAVGAGGGGEHPGDGVRAGDNEGGEEWHEQLR